MAPNPNLSKADGAGNEEDVTVGKSGGLSSPVDSRMGRKNTGSRVQLRSWLSWPGASDLPSLYLSFLICKMRVFLAPTSKG